MLTAKPILADLRFFYFFFFTGFYSQAAIESGAPRASLRLLRFCSSPRRPNRRQLQKSTKFPLFSQVFNRHKAISCLPHLIGTIDDCRNEYLLCTR